MFFVLSKTVSLLFMPLSLVFFFFIGAWIIKTPRTRRILFWTGIILLVFFSNQWLSNLAMRSWELPPVEFSAMKKHRLGIVLTGTTVSRPYTSDRVYFHKGADRVTHTVQLYKLGLIEKILISGGSGRLTGQHEPEANQFRKAMILMGVDSTAIIIENETRNTYESAVAVKPMLDSLGFHGEECVLITSAFHMRRSLACYRKAGINLMAFPTDYYSSTPSFSLDEILVPGADAINAWQKLFREWIGFAAYKVAGYV
jgi:uncharacterized SAM-binding protein YcdF (DUF218 family)